MRARSSPPNFRAEDWTGVVLPVEVSSQAAKRRLGVRESLSESSSMSHSVSSKPSFTVWMPVCDAPKLGATTSERRGLIEHGGLSDVGGEMQCWPNALVLE